ncbi:MAG: DNA primase [Actinomycetaceae bacterium]|nr:DNA primase [Actinomycetaceae bacterium]MDU0970992.1 DNA primase [Actinomycetaceae bacterium]
MPGLIKREDIDLVRERARIEDVVGEYVTLKSAGVHTLKGLCPLHDERTPSFHVDPVRGRWHCFGCGQGGDTIEFLIQYLKISFVEAVEMLAERYGVELHREAGDAVASKERQSIRRSIQLANAAAQQYFTAQLHTPAGLAARTFVAQRGFGPDVAATYGLGYAPAGWDGLLTHLRKQGFTEEELDASGLFSRGQRGLYDRFRDRLMFPIRSVTGVTIGFGARMLATDDDGPKYLNTPETPLYKKSQVLYGIDMARKEIAKRRQVVVVEGYTDVMAAHLAGIPNAVATCGTAFGADHVRIVRRLMGDTDDRAAGVQFSDGRSYGGEVIFTFDGDAAGQKAALRAFREDQSFGAQTYVVVSPGNMDPCEVRLAEGDQVLRDLVLTRKKPLFEFVIRSYLNQCDLDTAEGRVKGLRGSAPIVADIRDDALSREYARELAGWLGMPEDQVINAVASARRQRSRGGNGGYQGGGYPGDAPNPGEGAGPGAPFGGPGQAMAGQMGAITDPMTRLEMQTLQAVLQAPAAVADMEFDQLGADAFTNPVFRTVYDTICAIGGISRFLELQQQAGRERTPEQATQVAERAWVDEILEAGKGLVDGAISQLAVQPLPVDRPDLEADYARGILSAFERKAIMHVIGQLRSKLSRLSEDDPEQEEIARRLIQLETKRRALAERG